MPVVRPLLTHTPCTHTPKFSCRKKPRSYAAVLGAVQDYFSQLASPITYEAPPRRPRYRSRARTCFSGWSRHSLYSFFRRFTRFMVTGAHTKKVLGSAELARVRTERDRHNSVRAEGLSPETTVISLSKSYSLSYKCNCARCPYGSLGSGSCLLSGTPADRATNDSHTSILLHSERSTTNNPASKCKPWGCLRCTLS